MAAVDASLLFIALLVQRGTVYNIAFIVFFQNTMIEKCITTVELPPIHQLRLTRRVTKFWCRPVP
ncbi:uncharacterized protein LOC142768975 isoform X2 [Rhipicephalus microplus]|uniref:uncharacterized protein LOC142768975 isoform X2 n=1 Tax=Rhipicephalus microplus TaxID=6941 RepID=UPI003F6B637F